LPPIEERTKSTYKGKDVLLVEIWICQRHC